MRVSSFAGIGKVVGVFMSVLLVAMPALAQSSSEKEQPAKVQSDTIQGQPTKTLSDAEQGKIDGEGDGKKSVNAYLWLAGGCLIGALAVVLAYLVPLSKASPVILLGKSPEYVTFYSDSFERAAKKKQGLFALIGFGVFAVSYAIYYLYWILSRGYDY